MGRFSGLTDQQLADKIVRYETAQEEVDLGESVIVVAGEGRRTEFTRANSANIRTTLDALLRERDRRNGTGGRGQAIEVIF